MNSAESKEQFECLQDFLTDLQKLSKRHGIWIEGNFCPQCNVPQVLPYLRGSLRAINLTCFENSEYCADLTVYVRSEEDEES